MIFSSNSITWICKKSVSPMRLVLILMIQMLKTMLNNRNQRRHHWRVDGVALSQIVQLLQFQMDLVEMEQDVLHRYHQICNNQKQRQDDQLQLY